MCFTLELTPFKTITVTYTAKHHKLTPFKTLTFCNQFGLLSRPSRFWTQIDSFQDPCRGLSETSPNWLISRPSYWFITVFQSPWERLPAKSPWETSSIHNSSKHPTQWILDFIVKQKEKDSSHIDNRHISRPKINTFYTKHHHFHQNWFLSTPKKLHIIHWQQYPSKDTIFSTPTQDKDTITVHIANLYILISDLKLLKSTLCPLRTHSRLSKSK